MTAFRRRQLIRLGVWVSLATVAALTTVLAARTETGVRRIASLITPPAPEATRVAKAPAQVVSDAEQRRLAEAVRELSADRDRLQARLASVERSLDDAVTTGSIPPAAASAPSSPPAASSVTVSSLPAIASDPPATVPAQSNPGAPPRIAAGHMATASPAGAESTATRTEFGVDIGGNPSIEGLRTAWTVLKASHPGLFEGLRPVIAVREGKMPGSIELRLIAGPLPNAGIAARLCAALAAANQSCQPTVFDGQKLALQ